MDKKCENIHAYKQSYAKAKSDCNYIPELDLETKGIPFFVPNQPGRM